MNNFLNVLLTACLSAVIAVTSTHAQTHAQTLEKVSAEVIKVDAERGKVTLKHAPIKSIKMAAMTMAFKVIDPVMLSAVKPGDQVWFSIAMQDDEPVVMHLHPAAKSKVKVAR